MPVKAKVIDAPPLGHAYLNPLEWGSEKCKAPLTAEVDR